MDFGAVFAALKKILVPHAKKCVVAKDVPELYYLDTKKEYRGKPLFFAAVRAGKSYVSFHLFPVYCFPDLLDGASKELEKHRQGKACFNFKDVDAKLFAELAKLTKKGADAFAKREIPGADG